MKKTYSKPELGVKKFTQLEDVYTITEPMSTTEGVPHCYELPPLPKYSGFKPKL